MSQISPKLQWAVWGFLGGVILAVTVVFFFPKTDIPHLPVYQQIGTFALTNQQGQVITVDSLRGNVCVVNVIFTRCAGPCAKLTKELKQVQDAFVGAVQVRFVSLTADPVYDRPEILREYGRRFGADNNRWHFLTGPKRDVYDLAIQQLKFTVLDDERDRQPDEDLFIHSTRFVVLDGAGRVRDYVDGTEPDTVKRLVADVTTLLKERSK